MLSIGQIKAIWIDEIQLSTSKKCIFAQIIDKKNQLKSFQGADSDILEDMNGGINEDDFVDNTVVIYNSIRATILYNKDTN